MAADVVGADDADPAASLSVGCVAGSDVVPVRSAFGKDDDSFFRQSRFWSGAARAVAVEESSLAIGHRCVDTLVPLGCHNDRHFAPHQIRTHYQPAVQ